MTDWSKKYGDKGIGTEHVQERPHILATIHKPHPHKYPYMMWCTIHYIPSQSDCIWNPITTTLTDLSQNTTCRDIYVGVTCGQ